MGGKGDTGPSATNDQIVQMQMQQAAQAKESNAERNARLSYGTNLIKSMFEGRPSDAKKLDLSSLLNPSAASSTLTNATQTPQLPIGQAALGPAATQNTATQTPAQAARGGQLGQAPFGSAPTTGTPTSTGEPPPSASAVAAMYGGGTGSSASSQGGSLADGYTWKALPDNGGNQAYGIFDSAGNMVTAANSLSDLAASSIYYGGSGDLTGGFGDDFYDKYNQSILDYYLPQEGDQYNTARSSLAYSLARAGTLDSSVAGMDIGKLANQDAVNRAQIASQADTQTGALRSTIAQDEQSALNQLYSTEDPSVAANTAGNMVANAQLTKPMLNPSGALFSALTVGVGNALSGFLNPTAYINPSASGSAATPGGVKDYGQTVST